MENEGRTYENVPFYNINLILEKYEDFKNNPFVQWDGSEDSIFISWLICCFSNNERSSGDDFRAIQLVKRLFEEYMQKIVDSYCQDHYRIFYFTIWIDNTYNLLQEAASLYSDTYRTPGFEGVHKDLLLFSKIEERFSDRKSSRFPRLIENHLLYRGLLDVLIRLYVDYTPVETLFNDIDQSIILYNVWGKRYGDRYSYYSTLPIIVSKEGLAITNRSENRQYFRDIIETHFRDYNLAYNESLTEALLHKINLPNWLDSLCEFFCSQKKVRDSYKVRDLILGWVVSTMYIVNHVYRDIIHELNPYRSSKWTYDSPFDDFFFSFMLPELMRLLRNCTRQIISFYNEDPYIMPMEDHQNESENLSDDANDSTNDNINYSETEVPTGYLHFTTSDEDTQKKIYNFLHDRIGKKPGYKEYLYLAALINLKQILIPEYNDLIPVFPMFADKKYYPNFIHFFGNSGVYLAPFSADTYEKIKKKIVEIHTCIPEISLPSDMS